MIGRGTGVSQSSISQYVENVTTKLAYNLKLTLMLKIENIRKT